MSLVATTSALARALGRPRADFRVAGRPPLDPPPRPPRTVADVPIRPFRPDRRAAHSARRAVADSADEPTEGGIPLRNLRGDLERARGADLEAEPSFKSTGLYAAGLVAYSTLGVAGCKRDQRGGGGGAVRCT